MAIIVSTAVAGLAAAWPKLLQEVLCDLLVNSLTTIPFPCHLCTGHIHNSTYVLNCQAAIS